MSRAAWARHAEGKPPTPRGETDEMTSAELACRELVEVVTDYLEGALDDADRRRFQDHLDQCADCRTYVEQLRSTLRLLGRLAPGEIDDAVLQGLLAAFADWTAAPSPATSPATSPA